MWNFNNPGFKLLEDGLWGGKTEEALMSCSLSGFAKTFEDKIPVSPPIEIISLREGMSGSAVRSLQKALNDKNFAVTVDGIFGSETAAVVKKFRLKAD